MPQQLLDAIHILLVLVWILVGLTVLTFTFLIGHFYGWKKATEDHLREIEECKKRMEEKYQTDDL